MESACIVHILSGIKSVGGTVVSDSDIDNHVDDHALFDILVN
jgi:hypothetical protein